MSGIKIPAAAVVLCYVPMFGLGTSSSHNGHRAESFLFGRCSSPNIRRELRRQRDVGISRIIVLRHFFLHCRYLKMDTGV